MHLRTFTIIPLININYFISSTEGINNRPYYLWFRDTYSDLDEHTNSEGKFKTLACPLGHYRDFGDDYNREPGGYQLDGCLKCPKGFYGNSTDLSSPNCTSPCPKGTYLNRQGGESIHDCISCPEGTFGEEEGLTTSACSGSCTDLNTETTQYYSNQERLQSREDCKVCPYGYPGWQCQYKPPVFRDQDEHYLNGYKDLGEDIWDNPEIWAGEEEFDEDDEEVYDDEMERRWESQRESLTRIIDIIN